MVTQEDIDFEDRVQNTGYIPMPENMIIAENISDLFEE